MNQWRDRGKRLLRLIEYIVLGVIAFSTVIAIGVEILSMVNARSVTIADLLYLFIYLEVLAMVSIYLDSGKLPLNIPLYIAIVALARYLMLDMKSIDTWRMLGVSGATLLIALTVLVMRYGRARFPDNDEHA
jgi:protein PsiE